MDLAEKERILVAHLLDMASDEYSNHGCNDFDWEQFFTKDEMKKICQDIETWNGSPEEYDENHLHTPDWLFMSYYRDRILKNSRSPLAKEEEGSINNGLVKKMTETKPIKCESCGALIYDKDKDRLPMCSACHGFSRSDGNLSNRKKPKDNRYGQAQRLVDAVQELIALKSEAYNVADDDDGPYMRTVYNTETMEKMLSILNELRSWDVTKNGSLYLTGGGRVVLDKGYGEYFGDGDTELLGLGQLHSGMQLDKFIKMLTDAKANRKE